MQETDASNKRSSKNKQARKTRSDSRPKSDKSKHDLSRPHRDRSSDIIRTSTPIDPLAKTKSSRQHRSSSLPPQRDSLSQSSRSGRSTPAQSFSTHEFPPNTSRRGRSRSSSRTASTLNLSDSSFQSSSSSRKAHTQSPDPPTFLVIEKTMGQKSMIICWTPPLLDMVSFCLINKNFTLLYIQLSI